VWVTVINTLAYITTVFLYHCKKFFNGTGPWQSQLQVEKE
jgi:hypothetical protein